MKPTMDASLRAAGPAAAALLVFYLTVAPARAAAPEFRQILPEREIQTILELDGTVFTGLTRGGVLLWEAASPAVTGRWQAGAQIAGNDVRALAWTGLHLWVATRGAGLTMVTDPTGTPSFRQYATNLAGLDLTAVTGTLLGASERVFYGTDGQGLGLIVDGLSSSVFTRENDGVISNTIADLHFLGDALFIATPAGVSRFADNLFTDQNAGLSDLEIRDLDLDPDGSLLAAGRGGVFRWDEQAEAWSRVLDFTADTMRIGCDGTDIYALGADSSIYRITATGWSVVPAAEPAATALYAGQDVWVGGGLSLSHGNGLLWKAYLAKLTAPDAFTSIRTDATQVVNGMGAAFGADGTAYMGDFQGLYISWQDRDGAWRHIYETPNAENDTLTLHPDRGNILAMDRGADGKIYAGQYSGGGLLRYDPAANRTDLIDPDNSSLNGRNVVGLRAHPQGPVIVLHDHWDPEMVDVLVDPDDWGNPASWTTITRDDGLGEGTSTWDALIERDDVVWFAVEGVGLVRWDINGDAAGPDDPLTWFDRTDDRWDPPISSFGAGYTLDPKQAHSLARGNKSTLWAGGNGLVQFAYDPDTREIEVWHALGERRGASETGLVNGNVRSIARARDGIWVATATGVNRVRSTASTVAVDSWIDLVNYVSNPDYGALYSPSVIAPLPGNQYQKVVASDDGSRLLLGADQGFVMITAGPAQETDAGSGGDALAGIYCYPNPWSPGEDAGMLTIGGLPAAADASRPVQVELYSLEGQPVWRGTHTGGDEPFAFWNGINKEDRYVVTGLYVLRVTWNGMHATRTVAVVR